MTTHGRPHSFLVIIHWSGYPFPPLRLQDIIRHETRVTALLRTRPLIPPRFRIPSAPGLSVSPVLSLPAGMVSLGRQLNMGLWSLLARHGVCLAAVLPRAESPLPQKISHAGSLFSPPEKRLREFRLCIKNWSSASLGFCFPLFCIYYWPRPFPHLIRSTRSGC
jgi:hypothetical protein